MELDQLESKNDDRGRLVEAYKLPNDGQVFYLFIYPNETRGGHYHTHKIESFLVVHGSAIMTAKNRDTGDVFKVEANGEKPLRMTIHPNHTHSITATSEGAIVMVHANEIYNEDDNDTFPEEI